MFNVSDYDLEDDLQHVRAYLAATSEGLGKHSTRAELPCCIREIARNLNSLADMVERHNESNAEAR
jgi:hypothetical protein